MTESSESYRVAFEPEVIPCYVHKIGISLLEVFLSVYLRPYDQRRQSAGGYLQPGHHSSNHTSSLSIGLCCGPRLGHAIEFGSGRGVRVYLRR